MKQITFIHMADLHLDTPFSSLADEEKAKVRRNDLEKCFEDIVEKVRTQNSNLLIISGDFFEDSTVRGSSIMRARNLFSELYKTEIVICPGNHDPIRESSFYKISEWGSNVHILEDSQQVLYLEKYDTCIYNMGARGDIVNDYNTIKNMKINNLHYNILLLHGTVDIPFEENYNPITSNELFALGMDYIALGHMHCHSRQQNGRTVIINPGSPEPLGFDEEGSHGIIQGLISKSEDNKKSIETIFIPTARRHYHNLEVNITDCACDNETINRILSENGDKFSEDGLYSIVLNGFISKEYKPGIKNIVTALEDRCFYARIKNQTSTRLEYEAFLEDPGIKGEFVRRIVDMLEEEVSEKKKETLYLALQYGLQAIETGRVD